MNTDRLLELVEQVYAAPGTVDGWATFLDALRATLHGATANLIRHDLRSKRGDMLVTSGADPGSAALYVRQWSAFDPWAYSPRQSALRHQVVTTGDELVPHSELQRTAFYFEFARHYDIVRILGGVVEQSVELSSVISVSRSEQGRPFGAAEKAWLEALVPHIRRALALHEKLVTTENAAWALTDVVNRLPVATLLVNVKAEVTFLNDAAARLVAGRDGLVMERRDLRALVPAETARLRDLVRKAGQPLTLAAGDGVLAVSRRSARRPFIVRVCPLVRGFDVRMPEATVAMVSVTDPDRPAPPDTTTLTVVYGLTAAESRLTVLIASGLSLDDAAKRLGVHRETLRSRLKTIFEKTGTHRQSELVRLVLMSGSQLYVPFS